MSSFGQHVKPNYIMFYQDVQLCSYTHVGTYTLVGVKSLQVKYKNLSNKLKYNYKIFLSNKNKYLCGSKDTCFIA